MAEVNERDLVRVTGLWKRRTKNGKEYYAGPLTKTSTMFVFPAFQREHGKPEWIVYLGKPGAGSSGEEEQEIVY